MIVKTERGDVRNSRLPVVIAASTTLAEIRFKNGGGVGDLFDLPLKGGNIVTFLDDRNRHIFAIVCHESGPKAAEEGELKKHLGWLDAERHLRFGFDSIAHRHARGQEFATVEIGRSACGRAGSASLASIGRAMRESHLPLVVYKKYADGCVPLADLTHIEPIEVVSIWRAEYGERSIRRASRVAA